VGLEDTIDEQPNGGGNGFKFWGYNALDLMRRWNARWAPSATRMSDDAAPLMAPLRESATGARLLLGASGALSMCGCTNG